MQKLLSAAAIAFFSLTGLAHASTLQITLGPSLSFSAGTAVTPTINLATDSNLSLSRAAVISVPAPPNPTFVVPSGPKFGGNFLSVFGGTNNAPPGTALFSLGTGHDVFGFTWGTVDKFNKLILTDSSGGVFTITGAEILNHIAYPQAGKSQENVKFVDPFGSIVSAFLVSGRDSFEIANVGQAEMPLPPAVTLFGAALLASAFFMRRRRNKAI